jgi:Fe-S-cluster containining protein
MPRSKTAGADKTRRRCQHDCRGRCCRYITIQISAPRLKSDFDEISWFLAHRDVSVYVESRRWNVEVRNRCKHLMRNNLCAIYERRPDVCRGYEAEVCEYPERPVHDRQFDSQDEFDVWWSKRRERQRRKRRAARNRSSGTG